MNKEIYIGNSSETIPVPAICPRCHQGMTPDIRSYAQNWTDDDDFGVVFSCPVCKHIFFVSYVWAYNENNSSGPCMEISSVYPSFPTIEIPSEMETLYPDFYQLYSQSAIAEASGLTLISGMGYRKALEFLIKNYLTKNNAEENDEILKEPLSASIKRIPYPRIRALAKASSWLGNDETHVVKKNPEYNVSDMKQFMLALCYLILAEDVSDKTFPLLRST